MNNSMVPGSYFPDAFTCLPSDGSDPDQEQVGGSLLLTEPDLMRLHSGLRFEGFYRRIPDSRPLCFAGFSLGTVLRSASEGSTYHRTNALTRLLIGSEVKGWLWSPSAHMALLTPHEPLMVESLRLGC
ncbi:hypothetical protein NQZ68_034553 [Dissostichus eleginoides]|nr:hypothetical protein NQZ68_034553 [Dissostichus eleginoides]